MHWLFEIESRPESEIGDIAIESQAQVTRMDKLPEDWTNEDWKKFIEYMLEYIENEKQSVLVKPPPNTRFLYYESSAVSNLGSNVHNIH
ncbi:hypothetical protein NEIG_02456 [Nematocida sp. ERTm5]|nr:hypothetical protein NEIG_02456 [Nematocida sp. ERTm5]